MHTGCDNGLRVRISDHPCDSSIGNCTIQWHSAEPATNDAEHRLDHFVAIGHQYDDPVTMAQSEIVERVGDLHRAGTELCPANDAIAIDHGVFGRA